MSAEQRSTLSRSIAVNILSAALATKDIWHTKEIASIANKGGQNEHNYNHNHRRNSAGFHYLCRFKKIALRHSSSTTQVVELGGKYRN